MDNRRNQVVSSLFCLQKWHPWSLPKTQWALPPHTSGWLELKASSSLHLTTKSRRKYIIVCPEKGNDVNGHTPNCFTAELSLGSEEHWKRANFNCECSQFSETPRMVPLVYNETLRNYKSPHLHTHTLTVWTVSSPPVLTDLSIAPFYWLSNLILQEGLMQVLFTKAEGQAICNVITFSSPPSDIPKKFIAGIMCPSSPQVKCTPKRMFLILNH